MVLKADVKVTGHVSVHGAIIPIMILSCSLTWQVANYKEFAEQRAAQLGRTFDSLVSNAEATGACRITAAC